MTAVPPPEPQQAQPSQPAPAQYQPFVPQQGIGYSQQPGVVYPSQPGVVYPPQPGVVYPPQQYAQPGNPQFPNGVQGSAYRPGSGLQSRVNGNYRWALLLFVLPGVIGIPIFIGFVIWANLVT